MNDLWLGVVLGIILIAGSLLTLPGDGVYRGFTFPAAGVWVLLFTGISIIILSIRGLLRGEGKPQSFTDEDARRAKEKLDRMYLLEHGTLPPPPDTPDKETESETGGDKKEP